MKTKHSLLLLAGMLALISPSGAAEPTAEAVLNAAAIGHGLVVHGGASDGCLAEALARNQQFRVHALARDPRPQGDSDSGSGRRVCDRLLC